MSLSTLRFSAPLFWGVLTCFRRSSRSSARPPIVWLPLAVYMGLDGNWGRSRAQRVRRYCIVTQVDNLVRTFHAKRMTDARIRSSLTIFREFFIRLSLFGFHGRHLWTR